MSEIEHAPPKYSRIFWALLILTVFELIIANLHFLKTAMVFSLVSLAIIKACLVALFYMHLKFEKLLLYIFMIIPLILSVVLVLLVMLDAPK